MSVILGVDHVQLAMPSGREADAQRFYRDTLGIPEIPKPPHLATRGGAWFENAQVKIHLGVEHDFRPARKAHPGLLVANLRDLVRRLRDAGYKVVEDSSTEEPKHVYVLDPFGNRIELIQVPEANG